MQDSNLIFLTQKIIQWRNNALLFVEEVIQPEIITSQQREYLEALPKHKFIAIKSGHGIGKSALESWTLLWFLVCFTDCRVPVTAPTQDQITKMLWPEIMKWLESSLLKDVIQWEKAKVYVKGEEETAFAIYRTATRPEALQGFHATNIMFVLEEASGIEDVIWQPMEGALTTPGARAIAFGNPTRPEGEFYNIFTKNSGLWKTFTFSSEDSEIVSKDYVERMEKKYGRDSDVFRVRVLGEFPSKTSDAFIPLYLCERSLNLELQASPRLSMGVDVARFGDDYTVFLIRGGGRIIYCKKYQGWETAQIVGECKRLIRQFQIAPENVSVDAIGVGAGVVDILVDDGYDVNGVSVSESAMSQDEVTFLNKRVELWYTIKEALQNQELNLLIPEDEELTQELVGELATPKYKITRKGQYQLESKDDMKRRGISSPNIADALSLSYYIADESISDVISGKSDIYPEQL